MTCRYELVVDGERCDVRDLGVTFDSELTMQRAAYLQIVHGI